MRLGTGTTALVLALLPAGCGGDDGMTVYLRARLGPDGPKGQRSAILAPVERERRETMAASRQAVLDLLVGPSPDERARGFLDTIPLGTRLLAVEVAGRSATVWLGGEEPRLAGAAAIVYSLTELPGVDRVAIRLNGAPCCVYSHAGTPISPLTRSHFRYWSGEPCDTRTTPTHVRCVD